MAASQWRSSKRRTITAAAWLLGAAAVAATAGLGLGLNRSPPAPTAETGAPAPGGAYAGTAVCRECHEAFYKLWAPSHHGLAMQPMTAELAKTLSAGPAEGVTVGGHTYRPEFNGSGGRVRDSGPQGEIVYRMAHVLGGKNVYYFLTPMDRGRLQVLPIAYDMRQGKWYDTAASSVRHFLGGPSDEALPWTDPAYTFNTSCYGCHVSQLSTNYDLATDTYRTAWSEPGINCETCHGPGAEHVGVCRGAPQGRPPADLKIIRTKNFTAAQHNDTCAACHAKRAPITASFPPGGRFFDHGDLVTLEDPDFYPDGRDLGENYTYTLWLTSPCAKSGKLDCTHCHTASGRYRFAEAASANQACLPCHKERVNDPKPHTHHDADKAGGKCIDCHMPRTEFARMMRTDHSMRPPTPAATLALGSPNACNLCHADKGADWADACVRRWCAQDYQAAVLKRAGLVAAARKRDWGRLDEMLAYVVSPGRDEVFATGLIRLLAACPDQRKRPVLVKALKDPSALVRSSAAAGLAGHLDREVCAALLEAVGDDCRLVRVRAAGALAEYPRELLGPRDAARLGRAAAELEASLKCRPDDWASHYSLGGYLAARGDPAGALAAYETASKLRPDAVPPLVNASMIYAGLGRLADAERLLTAALKAAPNDAAVNFNLGLLMAEKGDPAAAERHLRAAVKADPTMADAAYNLGVLLAGSRRAEAIEWCRKAAELRPDSAKFAYGLAFYLHQANDLDGAAAALARLVDAGTDFAEAYALLADIYEKQGKLESARATCRRALASDSLPAREKPPFQARLQALERR